MHNIGVVIGIWSSRWQKDPLNIGRSCVYSEYISMFWFVQRPFSSGFDLQYKYMWKAISDSHAIYHFDVDV